MKVSKYDYDGVFNKIKNGMTTKEACEEAGVNVGSFNSWYYSKGKSSQKKKAKPDRREKRRYTRKPSVTRIEVPTEVQTGGRVLAFFGNPADIAAAVRGLQ